MENRIFARKFVDGITGAVLEARDCGFSALSVEEQSEHIERAFRGIITGNTDDILAIFITILAIQPFLQQGKLRFILPDDESPDKMCENMNCTVYGELQEDDCNMLKYCFSCGGPSVPFQERKNALNS